MAPWWGPVEAGTEASLLQVGLVDGMKRTGHPAASLANNVFVDASDLNVMAPPWGHEP